KRCGNAKAAGATGCLIYDNTAESDFAILGSDDIPSAALSHASGQAILDQIARNGTTEFVISDHMAPIPVASGGSPSDFSSWGPAPDLKVKPDIAGFGSRIFSTISRHAAEVAGRPTPYASYSGTSMATPYISGCLALFLAAKGDRARGLMLPDIRTLLQNAAQPGLDFRTHMKASVGLQGAGLIHVMNMIRADATANPSRLFLNDT
ncbi:subtilisin-like protein, partial [Caulochytrium protostelioides]